MSLRHLLLDMLKERDFIPLDEYMCLCTSHEEYGYYRRNDPLGRAGDFITAPELSQIFGELVGVWIVMQWKYFGCPHTLYVCELGPGRGTLMKDILRTISKTPECRAAVKIYFIEQNETLRAMQKENVPEGTWLSHVEEIPDDQTLLLLANEFFDALPVQGYRFKDGQWWQAVIVRNDEVSGDEAEDIFDLVWQTCEEENVPDRVKIGIDYTFEISPISALMMEALCEKIATAGGCGLFFDYGYLMPPDRLTVRSFLKHNVVDCTVSPGLCDITADVDFVALSSAAQEGGCQVMPVINQREFLIQMGIKQRCEVLLGYAKNEEETRSLLSGVAKLIDPQEMGERFKVLCVLSQGLLPPWPFQASLGYEDTE